MQKNAIKSFVCSFVLSLLAVAAVGKVVLRMPVTPAKTTSNETSDIQNISLFREQPEANGVTTYEAQEEKIDLSSLEKLVAEPKETPKKETSENKETPEVVALEETSAEPEKTNVADVRQSTPLLDVPSEKVSVKPVYEPEPDVLTDLASAEEITLEPEVELQEVTEPLQQVALSDISDTIADEQTQNPISRQTVYMSEDEADERTVDSATILASLETTAPSIESLGNGGLIPLEENSEIRHTGINVVKTSDASQIAMLEPSALVRTIDAYDEQPEPTLDEANLKADVTAEENTEEDSPWVVAESHPEEEPVTATSADISSAEDSPWVVARGNRFAKNKVIVEQFREEEPQEEVPVVEQKVEPENVVGSENIAEPADVSEEPKESETPTASVIAPTEPEKPQERLVSEAEVETMRSVKETLQPQPLLKPIEGETKLAYKMIDNLLIPIPDDIKNDANLMPDLSVTPQDKAKEQNTMRTMQPTVMPTQSTPIAPKANKKKKQKSELKEEEKESGLFKSIAGWFSSKADDEPKEDKTVEKKKAKKSKTEKSGISYFQKSKNSTETEDDAPAIMPAELRLSFQPNRAEISGQTLRWIHAFADNARDHDGIYVEIRIDGTSSFALQQKRLNLLSTILAKRGVDYRKINIVFTSREPNSFIIRNIRFNNKPNIVREDKTEQKTYQTW